MWWWRRTGREGEENEEEEEEEGGKRMRWRRRRRTGREGEGGGGEGMFVHRKGQYRWYGGSTWGTKMCNTVPEGEPGLGLKLQQCHV